MAYKVHANGVRVLEDRLYGSDFQALSIPPSAINDSGFKYDGICRQPYEIDADIVFNWSTFYGCADVNTGLRIGGTEVESYNLSSYAPFLTWAGGSLVIDHKLTYWNKLKTAAQGVRYILQGGIKNTNWDHSASSIKEWSERHPRQLVGVSNGITYIISVRGREDPGNVGWTFHEAAEYGTSLGLQNLIDGDGGGSVSIAMRYPGGARDIFRGVLAENRAVPVFGYINLSMPLDTLSDPPPPPTGEVVKTHDIDVFTDGSIAIDGVKYVP